MINTEFIDLYEKYINQLIEEISAYKNEQNIWKIAPDIKNPAGNLALHLTGNLNYMIGVNLGHTSYVRNRDLEFSDKNVPREKIISDLRNVISVIKESLGKLNDEDFYAIYPIEMYGRTDMQTIFVLTMYIAHLNYHLGQVNYHRRLLDK